MLKKISKNTVAAQIIDQLTDLIRSGSIKAGERLPSERDMAEQLGVSRPPLRESLRVLEYAGVIETRYGDGIYVKSTGFLSGDNPLFARLLHQYSLEEMVEMRKVVEVAAIRLAVERANQEDMELLHEVQVRTRRSLDDVDEFIECDFAFHIGIAEATRNSMLYGTVEAMRKLMSDFNADLLKNRKCRADVCEHHEAILRALDLRDADEAARVMVAHLDNVVNMALAIQEANGNGKGH